MTWHDTTRHVPRREILSDFEEFHDLFKGFMLCYILFVAELFFTLPIINHSRRPFLATSLEQALRDHRVHLPKSSTFLNLNLNH